MAMTTNTIETPSDTDISERVRTIIATFVTPGPDRPSDIEEHHRILDDLGADSLDCIELWMEIENQFGIDIGDDQAEEVVTVGDLIDLVTVAVAEGVR